MKALIIEDEPMARASLIRLISRNFPDMEIVGVISSVRSAVDWFRDQNNMADVVFMDVELSDGNCFEIFRQTEVRGNVIMTTAYDNYAVKAFEVNSVDYLLKPVEAEALRRAVSRVASSGSRFSSERLADVLSHTTEYRKRFIVKVNDKIIPVETDTVAYFHSEDKNTYMTTVTGIGYVIDSSLDEVCEQVDPKAFFRVSRRFVISMGSIRSITRQLGGRLRLEITPPTQLEVTVSRSRVEDFLKWIEK